MSNNEKNAGDRFGICLPKSPAALLFYTDTRVYDIGLFFNYKNGRRDRIINAV